MAEKIIAFDVASHTTGVRLVSRMALGTFSTAAEIDTYVERLKREIDEAAEQMKRSLKEMQAEWQSGEGD